MSEQSDDLLKEAMKLPTRERARVAAELIATVDGEADVDAAAAWGAEIDRRLARIQNQGAKGEDWETVHARIAARLRSR